METNPVTAPGSTGSPGPAGDGAAVVEVIAEGLGHPEGPDLLPDGRIAFVETFRSRVSAWSPAAGLASYADVGGGPNACMLGLDGLYLTQTGGHAGEWRAEVQRTPAIERVTPSGAIEVVATAADGEPLLGPNDLTFGPDGRLYFTDPGLYDPENPSPGRICAIGRGGECTTLVRTGPTFPNGIVAEPDGALVWGDSYTREIRRLRPDREVELVATLPEGHVPDGMKLATNGDLYVATATSGGIDVLARDGSRRAFVATGGEPLNCVFRRDSLIVTDFGEVPQYDDAGLAAGVTCGRLLEVEVGTYGMPLHRGAVGPRP